MHSDHTNGKVAAGPWPVRLVVLTILGMLLSACGAGSADGPTVDQVSAVRVGSFDFAESELVAELYAQVLESNGLPVERLGIIGPREIVAPALQAGLVDLVPEYAGTAERHYSAAVNQPDDVGEGAATLQEILSRQGLVMLDPAPAQNVNVFVVTAEAASAHQLERISDLSSLAASLRFGGPVECSTRPFCLGGLSQVYGLEFAEFVPQRSLAVTAEALLRNEIDVAVMFSTAAELVSPQFLALEDDRNLQPREQIVPMVRIDAVERWGQAFTTSLNRLSADLTTAGLQRLNKAVTDGEQPATVAGDWLTTRASQE